MSDADRSLEILISTKADLDGAKAVEAQLDQDAEKAKELGAAYDELGGKLMGPSAKTEASDGVEAGSPGAGVSKSGASSGPSPVLPTVGRAAFPGGSDGAHGSQMVASAIGKAGEDVLGRLQAGIEGLRVAVAGLSAFFAGGRDPIQVADEKRQAIQDENPASLLNRGSEGGFADNGMADTQEQDSRAGAGSRETDESDPIGDGPAEAIQSAGEKMRAALEQNTRATAVLFSRTLDLMEEQNRRLDDVDRRITDLSGQIKSLKNL